MIRVFAKCPFCSRSVGVDDERPGMAFVPGPDPCDHLAVAVASLCAPPFTRKDLDDQKYAAYIASINNQLPSKDDKFGREWGGAWLFQHGKGVREYLGSDPLRGATQKDDGWWYYLYRLSVKDLKPWQQIDLVYHIEGGSADMLEDRSPGLGLFKLSQVDQSDLLAAMTGWAVFSLDPEVLAAAVRQKVKKCQKYGFRRAWPDAIVGKLENPSDSGPVSMQKNGLDIRFRDLGDNVPPMDDCRWQVDAWDGHGRCYPVGLAWLTDGAEEEIGRAYLLAILVWDPCRGQGVATAIIEACKERWPDLHLSRPISRAGYGLYLKTAPEFPPDECISWEKIESYLVHGLSREEVKKIARKDHLDSIKSFFDECEEDEDEDQNEEDEDQDEEDEEM